MLRNKSRKEVNGISVAREGFLKSKPLRHPGAEWRKDEKGLHVKIPYKKNRLIGFLPKSLSRTREQRVLLDEQGAFIWNLSDGEHSIREIAKKLSEQYNIQVHEAEAALDLYLVQLSKQKLVGFVLSESARKRHHR